jgi:hypothetical protein
MKLNDNLRELLGAKWGTMLFLLLMLLVLPVWTLAIGEYDLSAGLFLALVVPFCVFVLLRHYLGMAFLRKIGNIVRVMFFIAFALSFLAVGIHYAYQNWLPHTLPTLVFTNGNWMNGEKRDCFLNTKESRYMLDCTITPTETEPHQFDVTYSGADPTDPSMSGKPQAWTCKRTPESISCANSK